MAETIHQGTTGALSATTAARSITIIAHALGEPKRVAFTQLPVLTPALSTLHAQQVSASAARRSATG